MEENKTLMANPALVICLKSLYMDFIESEFDVVFNTDDYLFVKTFAKVG